MHAAQNPPNKASLRNQLLSTDIGNIDVRNEVPLNGPAPPEIPVANYNQYSPQQQQPQLQNNGYRMNLNPGVNGSNPHLNQFPPSPQMYGQPPMNYAPPGQPHSRRSSFQSSNGSFTKSSMNNFFNMNKYKNKFSDGGDDDEDGKDVMIEDTGNEMSFDDLSTLRDRGRYGGQSSYDSTPIIPTLTSAASARHGGSGDVSNVQYRKQMTAFKKQVMTNAGKMMVAPNDPRAMSLQSGGRNPYLEAHQNGYDPRAMSLQGGRNPYMNDPRAQSMTNQSPQPFQPRANSLTNQPQHFQPRTNSLTNQRFPPQNYPRAQSLTTNPYQNRPPHPGNNGPHYPPNGTRPPMNPGFHHPHPNQQLAPHPGPQKGPSPMRPRNSASGAPSTTNSYPQQQLHPNFPNRTSFNNDSGSKESFPPPIRSSHNSSSSSGYNPSTPTIEETPSFPENLDQNGSVTERSSESHPNDQSSHNGAKDVSHHYLADNTLNDNDHFDSSGLTFSDDSGMKDGSFNPESESTPSPFGESKQRGVLDPGHSVIDSPSKIPRTKGLPHLSLLKMRDEDPEEDEEEVQDRDINNNRHRVLDTVDETDALSDHTRSKTPPPSTSDNIYNKSPQRSPFGTPNRRPNSQSKHLSPSPLKNQGNFNTHQRFPANNKSISSMSEYSTFSGVSDTETNDYDSKKKLYQLAQNSGTTNDVFVTASQFSLMDNKNLGYKKNASLAQSYDEFPDTITEGDSLASETPKLDTSDQETFRTEEDYRKSDAPTVSDTQTIRNSVATETGSIKSSKSNNGSLKGSFKSPKFLKNWSKKRSDKKRNNSFEPVTKPVEIKSNDIRESALDSVGESTENGSFNATPTSVNVSKGLNIVDEQRVPSSHDFKRENNNQDFERFNTPSKSQQISDIYGGDNYKVDTTSTNSYSARDISQNNVASQPTSASGTYNSSSTNNTIDTDTEIDSDGIDVNGKASVAKLEEPVIVEEGVRLKSSFEPGINDDSANKKSVKKLNLTIEQLGIMEDKSALITELELVSRALGDSIRREIKLEDQLKGKDIISSPNLNHENQLREQSLLISNLEKQLNEERTKRYIAEEHVLLWENGLEPSALEVSYENEKLQSELSNKTELINKQQAELDNFSFENPNNTEKYDALEKANKEFENVTVPKLRNEIEVLNNDRKKLSMMMEKFKLLKIENAELERKLEEGDQLKDSQSRKLEEELAQMKQKFQNRINRRSDISLESRRQSLTTPTNSRIKKTFLSELGSSNSSIDVLKPPSPMNGKRINSFSLINVTSPNEK